VVVEEITPSICKALWVQIKALYTVNVTNSLIKEGCAIPLLECLLPVKFISNPEFT